jgi:hypothetical protein
MWMAGVSGVEASHDILVDLYFEIPCLWYPNVVPVGLMITSRQRVKVLCFRFLSNETEGIELEGVEFENPSLSYYLC